MKYEILASQVVYLSTIVEANSKEQAYDIAFQYGEWEEYQAERIVYSDTIELDN